MKHLFYSLIFFIVLLQGCDAPRGPAVIAVSYISGKPEESNYIKWLKSVNPEIQYRVMNKMSMDSVEIVFDDCAGLLLTGGEDVYPGRYGQDEDTVKCGTINFYRDSLEFLLIDLAIDRQTPIMGICRGQQILNVALGGSLIVDIPTEVHTQVYHRCYDWENCYHDVMVLNDNMLTAISGVSKGNVTSNHHQAVKILAKPFKVLATANDGIIEAIGWKDPTQQPWLLGVQWHPERMDSSNQLSWPLAENFLLQANKFQYN